MKFGDLFLLHKREFTNHLHNSLIPPHIPYNHKRVPHHVGVVAMNLYELAPVDTHYKVENRVQFLLYLLYDLWLFYILLQDLLLRIEWLYYLLQLDLCQTLVKLCWTNQRIYCLNELYLFSLLVWQTAYAFVNLASRFHDLYQLLNEGLCSHCCAQLNVNKAF